MASALPPKRSIKRKTINSAKIKTNQLGNWWDRTYPKWRIWQLVALIGLIFLILMWGISWLLRIGVFGDLTGQNIATTAMTMTGGLVAISYVVLKYRERISVEKAEQREDEQAADRKLSEAVTLLSDDKPIIQISGVYALAAVADEYGSAYNQRAVDILCAYIRSNKDPNYAVVESTIMGEIYKRTNEYHHHDIDLPAPNTQWSDCKLDFHGATFFEKVVFYNTYATKTVDLTNVVFCKEFIARTSSFMAGIDASGSTFQGHISLEDIRAGEASLIFEKSNINNGMSISYTHQADDIIPPNIKFEGAIFFMETISSGRFTVDGEVPIETQYEDLFDYGYYPHLEDDYLLRIEFPVGARLKWRDDFTFPLQGE
ncbi:hypothetical protein [Rothia terrae]|uniref:hypothetical protein n=1 Tax=Rothia terrae TaxID=396015 RepID=UPI0028817E45|nr:hypothetical protein [Rothia terrae]MDT0189111.1 hypothetical protein [Rothia terrae]